MALVQPAPDVVFLELRRRLEAAHYSEPLGIESCALVNKLLDDVQTLQRAVREHDERRQHAEDEKSALQQSVLPLRREKQHLLEANNALHAQLLSEAGKMDALEADWRRQLEQAQAHAANYQYLFNSQSFRLKAQENDIDRLKERVNALLQRANAFQAQPGTLVVVVIVENADAHVRVSAVGGGDDTEQAWSGPRQHMDVAPDFAIGKAVEAIDTRYSEFSCRFFSRKSGR